MTKPFDKPALDAFWKHLLDHVDPHGTEPPTNQATRIIAGRWLAVRRLRQGLSVDALVAQTGITAPALLLLETGLANAATLAPIEQQLIAALADGPESAELVASALAYALGKQSPDTRAAAWMRADLEHGEP